MERFPVIYKPKPASYGTSPLGVLAYIAVAGILGALAGWSLKEQEEKTSPKARKRTEYEVFFQSIEKARTDDPMAKFFVVTSGKKDMFTHEWIYSRAYPCRTFLEAVARYDDVVRRQDPSEKKARIILDPTEADYQRLKEDLREGREVQWDI